MLREITVAAGLLAALVFTAGNVSAQSNMETVNPPVPCLGATSASGDNCGPAQLHRHNVQTVNPPVPCLGATSAFGDYCGPAQLHRRDLSCREARQILRGRGYYNIETMTCGGRYHKFVAWKRGHALRITVSARSGRIVSIRRA